MTEQQERRIVKTALLPIFAVFVLFPLVAYGIVGIPLSIILACTCVASLLKD